MAVNCSTNRWATSNYIVAPTLAEGAGYTTIASAIAAAPANSTIFIKPGTYTEDFTMSAGITLAGWLGSDYIDGTIIKGKITISSAGSYAISGLRLETNGDNAIFVSGSGIITVYFTNCFLNASDTTFLSYTNSNASTGIKFQSCRGNVDTTGITYFVSSGAGLLEFMACNLGNGGSTITASSCSGGTMRFRNCYAQVPLTTTGTAGIEIDNSFINPQGTPTNVINHGGSNVSIRKISNSKIIAAINANPSVTIGAGATLEMIDVHTTSSDGTAVITGAGELRYHNISFANGSQSVINTSTTTPLKANVGKISFDQGANYLDDYEEGTWTPTIVGASAAGAGTYTTQVGTYTKVGRLVTLHFDLAWNAHTGTGLAKLGGLPFSSTGATESTFSTWGNTWATPPEYVVVASSGLTWFFFTNNSGGGVTIDATASSKGQIIYETTA